MDRRCSHLNGACLHRPYPPQATRFDELPPFSWREAGIVIGDALVLIVMFLAAVSWFAIWQVSLQ